MDKATFKRISDSWKRFDRSTAYGCAHSRPPRDYDPAHCRQMWNEYQNVLDEIYERA